MMKRTDKPGAVIIEGHVQGLANARALGKAGIPVVCVDKGTCVLQFSKYCLKKITCPDYKSDEFTAFLIESCQRENLQGWCLLPSNDHAVVNISMNKKVLSEYFKIITPSYDIIECIYSKIKLLNIAGECGVPYPEFITSRCEMQEQCLLRYPVLIKGEFGLDFYKTYRKKVFVAHEFDELKKIFGSLGPDDTIFIQEMIPDTGDNKTISFTAFSVKGKIKTFWMGRKVREHPVRFGTGTMAESVYIEECYISSEKLLARLNYTGVSEIEYLLDPRDGRYKLIEVNARTWLWVELAIRSGINYPVYIFNYLNDIKTEYPVDYTRGKKWINLYTDLFFNSKKTIKSKLGFREFINQYRGDFTVAMWDFTDPLPFFIYGILLINFIKKR